MEGNGMSWADMCKGGLTKGTEVKLADICGHSADQALLTRAALPAAATLRQLVNKAQDLKLQPTYTGISFNIEHSTGQRLFYNRVLAKGNKAAVCYEDVIFFSKLELTPILGVDILIHQSLAPCERCRTGYKKWAQDNSCTIVLSADKGYDFLPDNLIFIFSRTGTVFYVN